MEWRLGGTHGALGLGFERWRPLSVAGVRDVGYGSLLLEPGGARPRRSLSRS